MMCWKWLRCFILMDLVVKFEVVCESCLKMKIIMMVRRIYSFRGFIGFVCFSVGNYVEFWNLDGDFI